MYDHRGAWYIILGENVLVGLQIFHLGQDVTSDNDNHRQVYYITYIQSPEDCECKLR